MNGLYTGTNAEKPAFESLPPVVAELARMNFTGDLIPATWYLHPLLRKENKDEPNLIAIVVLAWLVYWHRPQQVRDEQSGHIIGWRKRFYGSRYRARYHAIAAARGLTKRQVQDAVTFLVRRKIVIRQVEDRLEENGHLVGNVVYLTLIPNAIRNLNEIYSPSDESAPPLPLRSDRYPEDEVDSSPVVSPITPERERGDATKGEGITPQRDRGRAGTGLLENIRETPKENPSSSSEPETDDDDASPPALGNEETSTATAPTTDALYDWLTAQRVNRRQAQCIVTTPELRDEAERQRLYWPFRKGIRTPGRWLTDAITNGFPPPDGYPGIAPPPCEERAGSEHKHVSPPKVQDPRPASPPVPLVLREEWEKVLPLLKGLFNKPTYSTHIRHLTPIEWDGTTLTLAVRHEFSLTYLHDRPKHQEALVAALSDVLGQEVAVEFRFAPATE